MLAFEALVSELEVGVTDGYSHKCFELRGLDANSRKVSNYGVAVQLWGYAVIYFQ